MKARREPAALAQKPSCGPRRRDEAHPPPYAVFWGVFLPRMHQLDTALGEEPPVAVEFAAYTKSDWSDALAH